MQNIDTLHDLYTEFLRDLYNAEVLLISGLLRFKQMSTRPDLKKNIERYLNASRAHMHQLEDLTENMRESLLEDHCRSMRSLIGEAKKLADRCSSEDIKDFAISASLQRINQCKLNLYESLIRMSDELGLRRNEEILRLCLKEERSIGKNLQMNTTIKQT